MKALVIPTLLALPFPTLAAQDAPVPLDLSSVDRLGHPSSPVALRTDLGCLRSLLDQASGGCLEASSVPTAGLLFPYPGENNTFSGSGFVGGGKNNVASAAGATVAGGRYNEATAHSATVAGGISNNAGDPWAFVGGGSNNIASRHAVVTGGSTNRALADYAVVGGGAGNYAGGEGATVGGGILNGVSGHIGTVAGGWSNSASGEYASVGGGFHNDAFGYASTLPGGLDNVATGAFSFAAGRRARDEHDGAFVWGDGQTATPKTSSKADEFTVYASGGARFFSNSSATTGVLLAPGGGSWTAVSDRAAKENVAPIDPRAVLELVLDLPITTWNYRAQSDSVRHMGPMAQDFHAAFGLGLGPTTIDTVDPDGVALAAIQGLHAELEALRERLQQLEEESRR